MGYRNYLNYIPKRQYNKIRTLTFDELKLMAIESAKVRGKLESYNLDEDDYDDTNYMIQEELIEPHLVEIYELGKYVDLGETPKKSTKKFFTKKESNLIVNNSDTEMIIVNKEFLKHIIELYKGYIQSFYKDMQIEREEFNTILKKMDKIEHEDYNKDDYYVLKSDQELTKEEMTALIKCANHVRSNATEWLLLTPFTLEENDDKITHSWKYEYVIFELVHLYKTFDWKRNVLVYSGH